MSSERPEEISEPSVSSARQTPPAGPSSSDTSTSGKSTSDTSTNVKPSSDASSGDRRDGQAAADRGPSDEASCHPTTILVRGETIRDQARNARSKDSSSQKDASSKDSSGSDSAAKDSSGKDKDSKNDSKGKEKPPVSEAKVRMQSRLPVLDDDSDVGVQKQQIVTRDGKADLAFTGTLLASAAPPSAPKGQWDEYRVYETNAGKHVFSKVSRTIAADEEDNYEAEVFDPTPSSMPSQLLRSARDLARSRPLTWTDAAVDFFGYDPLAKVLYRKLGGEFEEHIS